MQEKIVEQRARAEAEPLVVQPLLAGDLADPETYKRPGPEVAELQRRYAEVDPKKPMDEWFYEAQEG